MQWVNGQPVDHLNITDRGLSYGDGLFTTLASKQGRLLLWPLHLKRLQQGVERLKLGTLDWSQLERDVQGAAQQNPSVIKVILSRGRGGRGYSTKGVVGPTVILSIHSAPDYMYHWREHGITLSLASLQLARQPALAGMKSLNRLEQVLGRQELEQLETDEAVFCDSDGYLVECNASNFFWRNGEQWSTPDLSGSGVDGVMRQHIMQLFEQSKESIHLVRKRSDTLINADEIFITNSFMGVVPVVSYQKKRFLVGDKTRQLQLALHEDLL